VNNTVGKLLPVTFTNWRMSYLAVVVRKELGINDAATEVYYMKGAMESFRALRNLREENAWQQFLIDTCGLEEDD